MPEKDRYFEMEAAHLVQSVRGRWQQLAQHPERLQTPANRLVFAAGGGLPLIFGKQDSAIYQRISAQAEANNNQVVIAGETFSKQELEALGEYYRFLRKQGLILHCIDERLAGDHEGCVHDECGACAAVEASIGLRGASVEDMLLAELQQQDLGKQAIHEGMSSHDSSVILIDLTGQVAVTDAELVRELKNHSSLPFQVSLSVQKIEQFLQQRPLVEQDLLLQALVKWNVQIARNIVGGHHNLQQPIAERTTLVINKHDIDPENQIMTMLLSKIAQISHQAEIVID